MNKPFLLLLIILLLFSCKNESSDPVEIPPLEISEGVVVLNEGGLNYGNASISIILKDGTVVEDVFKGINDKSLGDVAQSIFDMGNELYIVVNNSAKIEVINKDDFTLITTIEGFHSPRYMAKVSDEEVWCTNIFNNKISIINTTSKTIEDNIELGCDEISIYDCGFDKILVSGDNVFISNWDQNSIFVFDKNNRSFIKELNTTFQTTDLIIYNDAIFCMNSDLGDKSGKLIKINPNSLEIEQTWETNDAGGYTNLLLEINGKMHLVTSGVFELDLSQSDLILTEKITGFETIYGAGVDRRFSQEKLYICDVLDYQQKGKIYKINTESFVIEDTVTAGIIPGKVYFY